MTPAVRLFIAINLPESERQAIHESTALLRAAAKSVTWVAPDCIHLTMKFLGEQQADDVPKVRDALAEVGRRFQPLRLDVGGVGAFPHLRAPRIFWMGIGADPKLELLHHDLEVACEALGHEVEARAFRPHITLGRLKRDVSVEDLAAMARLATNVRYRGTIEARSIDVMQSELSSGGPRYTVLARVPLGHS
ncbi:MAG TPA: RNA 2',3'-cyclic phosphodiesterase [Gemmatimonadaceae bacterium]|nr:RNA 2',3'-cyclic phosphodiesterase [Gemmatimonadaceae bacterium]